MKRVFMLMLAITVSFAALAQTKNINKANNAFTKGDLALAAELIEPATTDEKSSLNGKTWYVRGQIYGAIYTSEDPTINAIDPDALFKAVSSYKKVVELEKEGSTYYGLSEINLGSLTGAVLNKGVDAFSNEDYESALAAFDQYTKVVPEDTTGFVYAALMAQQLEKYEEVIKYYEGAFAIGYYPKTAFNTIVYYKLNKLDDPEGAIETIKLAQKTYPEDNDFKKTEVDILIKMDKLDEAITELSNAIKAEPDNAGLYTNLGLLYDSQEEYGLAVEQYKKALELNPSDRFSLINLAVFYIGRGDEINKTAIDMDMATFRKKGEEVEAQAKVEWSKAIPYLEKVLEAEANDELALQNLHAVYFKLKDYKNAEIMEAKRKEFGYIADDK